MTMLDISMLCGKCKEVFENAKSGDIVMICEKCEIFFPSVVKQSDCQPIGESDAAKTAEKNEKNAMTLMEELTDKFGVEENEEETHWEPGVVEGLRARNNSYGRRKYDRGPESEGK